jgi:membrane protease YdiL (CAAX protease family)
MLTAETRQETATTAWKPVVLYMIFAYGIAWILWLPLVLGPAGLHLTKYDAYLPFFTFFGTIGPLIASFLATRYEKGRWAMPSRLLPASRPVSWLNLLPGPALTIIAFVNIPYLICIAPGHKLIPLRFLAPLLAVWPNILGGPVEEEFGWRGYLLPRLSARIGNTWATLSVGVIWASWHLPLMLTHVWGVSFWYYLPLVVAVACLRR